MKLYLDTNILLALMGQGDCELNRDVFELIYDYSNLLYTSTVCIHEFVHLCQIGKVNLNIGHADIRLLLESINVEAVPVGMAHLYKLTELPLYADHRDPNDRLIVAQAIADRAALISSDAKIREFGIRYCS